jgi:hypothetical protein
MLRYFIYDTEQMFHLAAEFSLSNCRGIEINFRGQSPGYAHGLSFITCFASSVNVILSSLWSSVSQAYATMTAVDIYVDSRRVIIAWNLCTRFLYGVNLSAVPCALRKRMFGQILLPRVKYSYCQELAVFDGDLTLVKIFSGNLSKQSIFIQHGNLFLFIVFNRGFFSEYNVFK